MNAPAIPPQRTPPVDQVSQVGRGAIWRAGQVLALRQFLFAFWPFALVFKLALAAALLGLFPLLGPLAHTLLFLSFGAALLGSFIFSLRRYHGVSEEEARRAVERASGLQHRPLSTLADRPVTANGLWGLHRDRMAHAIRSVSLKAPSFSLRGLNSPALRLGSWAVLIIALMFAWDEAPRRIEEAAQPPVESLLPASKLDAWITPPAYTGQPPIVLQAGQAEVTVPEGSQLTVRVSGGWFPPVLELPSGNQRLRTEAGEAYQYTAPITRSGWVKLRQDGHYLGKWAVSFMLDTPPTIAFTKPPEPTEQLALRLDYTASDDLGLVKIEAEIEPAIAGVESPHLQPLVLPLPLPSPPPQHASAFRFFDLTAHPLAGSKVYITLRAYDGKGQVGETSPVSFTMPERNFRSPIAKALIRLRKDVLVRGLAARHPGAELVNGLAEEVEDEEGADFTGVLALRVIATRLKLSQDAGEIPGLERLMWDTALHFEDGGAGQALNQLRQAQQALEDALANGASDAEIQHLMQQLEQAMDEYLSQLSQMGQMQDQPQPDGTAQTIDRQDLQNMLDQMRQLAQSGARDQALEMLQQMQQMMESLRSGGQSGQGDPQLSRDMQRLEEIRRGQEGMMQSTPDGGQSHPGQQEAQQQENLRQQLGVTMQGLLERGYDVGELGHGERSMNSAREALEQNDQQGAAQQQGEALSHLQQGMQSLAEQAQQRARQGPGGSDPFGRRPDGEGGMDNSRVEIPDRQAAERARRVLEELRRRAGDYSRPPEEREYLERLLKWF